MKPDEEGQAVPEWFEALRKDPTQERLRQLAAQPGFNVNEEGCDGERISEWIHPWNMSCNLLLDLLHLGLDVTVPHKDGRSIVEHRCVLRGIEMDDREWVQLLLEYDCPFRMEMVSHVGIFRISYPGCPPPVAPQALADYAARVAERKVAARRAAVATLAALRGGPLGRDLARLVAARVWAGRRLI